MPRFILPEERDVEPNTSMQIAQAIQGMGGSVISREVYEASQIFTEPIEGEDLVFKAPQQPGGEAGGMPPMPGASGRPSAGEPSDPTNPMDSQSEPDPEPSENVGSKEMETEVVGASDK